MRWFSRLWWCRQRRLLSNLWRPWYRCRSRFRGGPGAKLPEGGSGPLGARPPSAGRSGTPPRCG
eukprot:1174825-Prorocentrum_lima.AAC.1